MLHIIKSNDAKKLTQYLSKDFGLNARTPFQFDVLCAPDAVQGRLKGELARLQSIFVGGVETPRQVAERIISGYTNEKSSDLKYGRDAMTLAVASSIQKRIGDPAFSSLRNYFGEYVSDKKLFSFSAVLSNLFAEYMMYRPQMLADWKRNADEWQGRLFQDVMARLGEDHFGEQALKAIRQLARGDLPQIQMPPRIFVFGISNLPPLLLQFFAAVSAHSDVYLYVISPSVEFFAYSSKESVDEDANSILHLLGRQTGYFQSALIDIAQQVPAMEIEDFSPPTETTILGEIQNSVLRNEPLKLSGTNRVDNSIQFHHSATSAREVDDLKNVILHSVAEENMLPSDIVVMAPNINEYAAHIDSVFSDKSIPFSIADRTNAEAAGAMEAIVRLLDVADGRLGLREVFGLLDNESVRKKFMLSRNDVKKCFLWCKEARIKSCIDSVHRNKMGLIPCKENTWRFGLERLFLGVAMESFSLFSGVSALSGFVGTEARILGRLSNFLETLFSFVALCEESRSVVAWCRGLEKTVEDILDTENEPDVLVHFRTTLQHLQHATAIASYENELDFDGFRFLLRGKFSSVRFQSSGGSGVRFSSFRYLRGERCKLVILLGMGEGKFPLEQRTPSFDLISSGPRPQDKDVKHDGYQMFLESLLGAIEKLVIFCNNDAAAREGSDAMCIPARELKNQIERSLPDSELQRFLEQCVFHYPVKSFDSKYFDPSFPKFFNYSSTDFFAAKAEQRQTCCQVDEVSTKNDGTDVLPHLPPLSGVVTPMSIGDFFLFWKNPILFYLQEKLGFSFPKAEEHQTDESPTHLAGLDEWTLGKLIIDGVLQQKSFEDMQLLIRSLGIAPAGNLGNFFSKRTHGRATKISDGAQEIIRNQRGEQRDIDIVLKTSTGQLRLFGSLDNIFGQTLLSYSYSSLNPRHLLRNWLMHLIYVHTSVSSENLQTVAIGRNGDNGERVSIPANPDVNNSTLNQIAEFTLEGLRSPIPFFPDFSATYVEHSRKMDSTAQAAFLQKTLRGMEQQLREDASPEARGLFEMDLFANNGQRFHHLATEVMKPLFDCSRKKVLK